MPDNRPNVIDSLTIELVGKAKSAIDALAEVNGQLLLLQSSLSKVKDTKITSDFINKSATDRIKELRTALSGYSSSEANAFKTAIETLSNVDTTGLKDIGAAAKGLSPLKKISEISSAPIKEFAQTLNEMNMSGIQKLGEAAKGLESFRAMARLSREGSGKHLAEVFRSLESVNPETLKKLGDASTGLKGFSSIATLSRNSEGFQVIIDGLMKLSGVDFTNLTYLTEAAKALADLYREYNKLYKAATKLSEAQNTVNIKFRDMTKETKKAGHAASRANGILGKFFATIKRIAFYRVIRSALRAITSGFSEGIENLYHWSQAVGTSFAPSMDRLATATLYLKNGFASMFSPLIEYAVPIIDALIDKIVEFFNIIQEGIARITGQATWNKALKYPVEYADAMDDATASAKAFKNQLLGFDELNVISTPSDSSRGKGSDALNYASMFQLMETEVAGSGKSIGARLADAIGEAFDDPEKFKGYGETAATAVGNAFDNTVDFFQEGHENGMFVRIGESLSNFLSSFATKLAEKIRDTDWPEAIDALTTAICDIIDGVDLGEVLKSLGKLIVSIAFSIPSMIIASLGSALKITASYIRMWGNAFGEDSFLGGLLLGSAGLLDSGAEKVNNVAKKWDAMGDLATNAVFNAMEGNGLSVSEEQLKEYRDAMAGLESASSGKGIEIPLSFDVADAIEPVRERWNKLKEWWGETKLHIGFVAWSIIEPVQKRWNDLKAWWNNAKLNLGFTASSIITAARERWNELVKWWNNAKINLGFTVDSLVSAVRVRWNELKEWWAGTKINLGVNVASMIDAVRGRWNAFKDWWGSTTFKFAPNIPSIIDAVKEKWDAFKTWWGNTKFDLGIRLPKISLKSGYSTKAADWIKDPSTIPQLQVKWEASGGFLPDSYSLFGMGENGVPEMLGTVGGRNAVAGGAEITGIRDAIERQAEQDRQLLLQLISAVRSKDLNLVANAQAGRWVENARKAYSGVTG